MTLRIGMADVFVGTIALVAIGGVAVAAISMERETANRVNCARNLRLVGQAILLYSNENRNAYPRTTYQADAPPVWGTPYADDAELVPFPRGDAFADEKAAKDVLAVKPQPNDVTAALYLLLATQNIKPNAFVCPSTRAKPFDYAGDDVRGFTNFPGKRALARTLSYSYQNPYPSKAAVAAGFKLNNALAAEFAAMADMNPGGDALMKIDPEGPFAEVSKGNSPNHGRDGQNVLYGDGHVEFVQSPFVGIGRDNIYVANDPLAARNVKRAGEPAIAASPADANDSILLPTAVDLGLDEPLAPVVPPAEGEEPARVFFGKYAGEITEILAQRPSRGRVPATLTLDEKTIGVTCGPQTVSYAYAVAGTRGDALVLTLKGPGVEETQAELTVVGPRFYIDCDEPTGLLKGDGGAGGGWSMAK